MHGYFLIQKERKEHLLEGSSVSTLGPNIGRLGSEFWINSEQELDTK